MDDISSLIQHANLVVSRAGAGALSEFAVCKTPAILIPYPYSADNHQEFNAAYAAKFGAALIIHQSDSNTRGLRRAIKLLLDSHYSYSKNQSDDLLQQMRNGMAQIAIRDAHLRLAAILKQHTQ